MNLLLSVYYFFIFLIVFTVLYTIYSLYSSYSEVPPVEILPIQLPPIETPTTSVETPPIEIPTVPIIIPPITTPPITTPTITTPPIIIPPITTDLITTPPITTIPTTTPSFQSTTIRNTEIHTIPKISDSNVILWLDGSDISTITLGSDRKSIVNWTDKSPNKYIFSQTIPSNQPTYNTNLKNGNKIVHFTKEKSQYLGGGTLLPIGKNNLSIFAVVKINSTSTLNGIFNKALYGDYPKNALLITRERTNLLSGLDKMAGYTEFTNTNIGYQLIEIIIDRILGKTVYYINGALQSTGTFTPDTTNNYDNNFNMIIGGYNNTNGKITPPYPNYYLDGDVCEILLYTHSTSFSNDNRLQVENYLKNKWTL